MKIYYTYDSRGFFAAKTETEMGDSLFVENLPQIFSDCLHDLNKDFCNSFQIYSEFGAVIFDSVLIKEAA